MLVILIRTILIYIMLIGAMRLMGKRQIGQLEVSDLVSTLLLSEIAALPIEDPSIPLVYALIPIIVVLAAEIFSAALLSRFPGLKNLLSVRPTLLIKMGHPQVDGLRRARISADELMVALRRSGNTDISKVAYAIFEQDGGISVIPTTEERPATAADVGRHPAEGGIYHIIIDNGRIDRHGLAAANKSEAWVEQLLQSEACRAEDIFLLLADDGGEVRVYKRQNAGCAGGAVGAVNKAEEDKGKCER